MNFFKSVFSADPDASDHSPHQHPISDAQEEEEQHADPQPAGSAWAFGGLIKTLASRSESVIQTYYRDLEELGSGLKKETTAIREAATRVVRDLPVSLEASAYAAQESLESVGQVIDELGGSVWCGTADIISQGKNALLSMDSDTETAAASESSTHNNCGAAKRYSRFETQVLGIQGDQNTFLEEPDDADDFILWNDGFVVEERDDEIDELCLENEILFSMFEKLVPRVVNYDTFWSRYFYKLHKLKQAEDARAKLVKRVISREEEDEDLSWEVDDDDNNEEKQEEVQREEEARTEAQQGVNKNSESEPSDTVIIDSSTQVAEHQVETVVEKIPVMLVKEVESEGKVEISELRGEEVSVTVSDDKTIPDEKVEPTESCKDSDISVVSSQPSTQEEDDLGWDEIEDIGESYEKKSAFSGGNTSKVDLHKRLSVAADDEDLSWDVEDD